MRGLLLSPSLSCRCRSRASSFGGVAPLACLPLCLDVGTNNEALLRDARYKGLRRKRLRGPPFDALVAELVAALTSRWPGLLLQFEDFGQHNAFSLLSEFRPRLLCFNDDIEGTAAVCLSGLLSAHAAAGVAPTDATVLFLGAGEAGTGIAQLFALYLHTRHGVPIDAARRRCVFVDSQGLVCASRAAADPKLAHHKRPFAHDIPFAPTFEAAIVATRPTALVGVSGQAGGFTRGSLDAFSRLGGRIVFPLSNPTSCAECTAAEAAAAIGDRLLFASGSPFDPLVLPGGARLNPSQANNALVFPGIGVGALAARATALDDEAFLAAAVRVEQHRARSACSDCSIIG